MEFPRLVYKLSGKHQRQGGTFDYFQVNDESEYKAAISGGWLNSLDESEVESNDNLPPTREELETKAKELGLKFDGRTSDAKLNTMIETALGAK